MQQAAPAGEPATAKSASTTPAATSDAAASSPAGTIAMVPERPAAPIPYRKESGGVGGSLVGALTATVLLLAVFVVALRYAKSRGLLDRWIVAGSAGTAAAKAGHDAMRVEQALRVSPRTTLYRIRDGERRFLLVESIAANARLLPLRDDDATPSIDDEYDDAH